MTPGRVSQIEHGEVSTVEALASYIAALGRKLELVANIGGRAQDAGQPGRLTPSRGGPGQLAVHSERSHEVATSAAGR